MKEFVSLALDVGTVSCSPHKPPERDKLKQGKIKKRTKVGRESEGTVELSVRKHED